MRFSVEIDMVRKRTVEIIFGVTKDLYLQTGVH